MLSRSRRKSPRRASANIKCRSAVRHRTLKKRWHDFEWLEERLALATDLVVTGTGGNDTLTLTATGPDSGAFSLNGGAPVPFVAINSFTFNGLGGNDAFTVNNPAGGLFAPAGGIIYDGGTQTSAQGDSLIISGGQAVNE